MNKAFYLQDTLMIAKQLLGKTLVREVDNVILKGKIVETEAYMGDCDKACHAYPMKITPRTEVLFEEGGIAYVYLIYGMYYCLNVVTQEEGVPHAILIRGIEPLNEIDVIAHNRFGKYYEHLTAYQKKNLTNGPGKLCKAYQVDKSLNGVSLLTGNLRIVDGEEVKDNQIAISKRINIDYAEEAKDFLWRYHLINNPFVSIKKEAGTKLASETKKPVKFYDE